MLENNIFQKNVNRKSIQYSLHIYQNTTHCITRQRISAFLNEWNDLIHQLLKELSYSSNDLFNKN